MAIMFAIKIRRKNELIPWIEGSNSQLGQESFVTWILGAKESGFFVEIGASHPSILSNTYILESRYLWRGIGLEIDSELCNLYNQNVSLSA